MHSAFLSLLAIGSLYLAPSSATPTASSSPASPSPGIAATVNHLDSKGMIHWTSTGNGGREAVIPESIIAYAHEQLSTPNNTKLLSTRGHPKADVGKFTNIGNIAGYAASYACEKSGAYGLSATIDGYAIDACTSLVSQVPAVPVAESAWRVWQSANAPGANGNAVSTIYRFFTNTAAAPTLTEQICTLAFQDLTSTFCQGKGDKNDATRGGEISIGAGDDYLMIGFDPNDA